MPRRRRSPPTVGSFVRFERRKLDPHRLYGFVLAVSDTLTLLNEFADFVRGGFAVVRNADVTGYCIYDRDTYFVNRALRLKGLRPRVSPRVDIRNWSTALLTAQRRFPLITIHPETRDPGCCYIGRIARLTEKTVTLHEIDSTALWDAQHRHRLVDITKLDFGGAYEDALWRVAVEDDKVPPIGV